VAAIIGQQGETVLAGRDTDHQVKIAYALSLCAKPTALLTKKPAHFRINSD